MSVHHKIIAATELYFDLEPGSLRSNNRSRHIAWPRQMAMYAMRLTTGASFPKIARSLDRKDHTTVIHGCRAFGKRAGDDPKCRHDLACVMGSVEKAA